MLRTDSKGLYVDVPSVDGWEFTGETVDNQGELFAQFRAIGTRDYAERWLAGGIYEAARYVDSEGYILCGSHAMVSRSEGHDIANVSDDALRDCDLCTAMNAADWDNDL